MGFKHGDTGTPFGRSTKEPGPGLDLQPLPVKAFACVSTVEILED